MGFWDGVKSAVDFLVFTPYRVSKWGYDKVKDVGGWLDNQFTGNRDYERSQNLANQANAFSAQQAQIEREFNSKQAQINRDFQENLSNTAYSRSISDVRKNGLNPYVALSSLGPASTPSGSTAYQASSPRGVAGNNVGARTDNILAGLLRGMISAYSLGKTANFQSFNKYGELVGSSQRYYT